jgi:dTDP-4-dehydrorhamnose 3,5-epimerase
VQNLLIFTETTLQGVFIIDIEKIVDDRGFFARAWDKDVFKENGLNNNLVQCNISFNKKKGTLRGMHYQDAPYQEAKLIRCTKGSVYEVMIDLRENSKTYLQWKSVELDSEKHKMLYVPEGFALGFQTLKDNTELFYQMSQFYMSEFSRGIRWDDKSFRISWPLEISVISEKDKSYDSFIPKSR